MPRVTIKTGISTPDGSQEELTEYLCDSPGCPNVATFVIGGVADLGIFVAFCPDHAPQKRS